MDTGRLPAYRSSYLLRFHPYPRAKLAARERIVASAWEHEHDALQADVHMEADTSFTLNQAIHETEVHDKVRLRRRRLSMSSLVVDLALLFMKRRSSHHD